MGVVYMQLCQNVFTINRLSKFCLNSVDVYRKCFTTVSFTQTSPNDQFQGRSAHRKLLLLANTQHANGTCEAH